MRALLSLQPSLTRTLTPRAALAALPLAVSLVLAVSLAPAVSLAALLPTDRVDLRVLLLSADGSEPSLAAWQAALAREGVPYDTIVATSAEPITAETLAKAPDHARYQAVVLATGGLYQCGAQGCFSALDIAEWQALDAFQARFGIRRVTAYAYPTPEYGLAYPFHSGDLAGTTPSLTAAGKVAFPELKGPVPIDVGSWGYYAEPAGAAFTTLVAGPAGPGGAAAAIAGVHARPDGFEELVVTVATNPYQLHAMLLSHGLVRWATRGVRLGYWRNYFNIHIDDVFLPDDRWDMVANTTHEDDGATLPKIRMVAADVDRALAWQAKTGLQLDMVFNGAGSQEAIEATGADPLTARFLKYRNEFYWINHTWSHPNIDAADALTIFKEITKNLLFAHKHKLPHHPSELVTGEHSGLANPALAVALQFTTVRWLAADNSRQPEAYDIGPARTVPRHPSNLYYNVGTFAEQLDEYNWIYYENCTNTALTTCLTAPATWSQYVDSEATIMLRHILTNDVRPHYAHQNNLAEDGTLYAVVDEVLARYQALVTAPITQPLFRDAGKRMDQHSAWGAAAAATQAWLQGSTVTIVASSSVEVPVSGLATGASYGGDRATWVKAKAGKAVKLTVAVMP